MTVPHRAEVWLVDFGLAGKTRPAVIVSVAFGDLDLALITVIPHTTSLRGSPFEIATRVSFLKPGAFLVQGVTTFPVVKALHRLGKLPPETFSSVMSGLLRWLGHVRSKPAHSPLPIPIRSHFSLFPQPLTLDPSQPRRACFTLKLHHALR